MPEVIRCRMQYELVLGQWNVDVSRDGRPVRHIKFADSAKVTEMARRGGAVRDSESRNMLEYGIRHGSGAVELFLTAEQFAKLKS